MRFVRYPRPLALCALFSTLVLSTRAGAQQGMDLGLGLDLTEATTDLRPTLAILGADLTEGDPKKDGWVVSYIGAMLTTDAAKSKLFASVMKPQEVAQKLGDRYAESLRCVEDTCMVEIASTLGVERVFNAQVSHGRASSTLKLNAFTRASLAVETATVEVKGPPRGDYFKKAVLALKPLLRSISGKLAHLKVTPSVDTAEVSLGDRELGTGTVDVRVSAGTYALKVSAEGYRPLQQQVALEEGGSADLQLTLERAPKGAGTGTGGAVAAAVEGRPGNDAGPRAPPSGGRPSARPPGSYFTHPGTYLGAAGAVALLVGAGVGASAMGAQGRLVDANGDGVLDITRTDALAAQSQATIANVLLAAGAVGLTGGGVWLLLAPPSKGGGVGVAAGGRF